MRNVPVGAGSSCQVIARILHIGVDQIGALSLKSTKPVAFTTGCAVFAESEAVSRIAEGALPEDIVAGVHMAMASKIVNLVVRVGLLEECAVTGGRRDRRGPREDHRDGTGSEGARSRGAPDHSGTRGSPPCVRGSARRTYVGWTKDVAGRFSMIECQNRTGEWL